MFSVKNKVENVKMTCREKHVSHSIPKKNIPRCCEIKVQARTSIHGSQLGQEPCTSMLNKEREMTCISHGSLVVHRVQVLEFWVWFGEEIKDPPWGNLEPVSIQIYS